MCVNLFLANELISTLCAFLKDGETPFHMGCQCCPVEIVELLWKRKADISVTDKVELSLLVDCVVWDVGECCSNETRM